MPAILPLAAAETSPGINGIKEQRSLWYLIIELESALSPRPAKVIIARHALIAIISALAECAEV